MSAFQEFKSRVAPSLESICRDLFERNKAAITIKKERVAVKNMMRILEAVFALSRQKGFQTMTLRDLSRESGLSMGALYSYFSGKDELRSMILRQGVAYTRRVLLEQARACADPSEKLEAAIEAHLYLSEVLRPWFYFAYMEASSLSKQDKRKAMEDELATEKLFLGILEEGAEAGEFRCPDAALAAALIKAVLQDWYLKRWKYKRRRITVEQYARFVVEFVLTGLTQEMVRRPLQQR